MRHAPARTCVSETAYNEYDSLFYCNGDVFSTKKKKYSIVYIV